MELPQHQAGPNNRCEVLGQKLRLLQIQQEEHQQAYEMFKESIDCLKEASSATTLYQYYTASFYTMKRALKGDTLAQANMRPKC